MREHHHVVADLERSETILTNEITNLRTLTFELSPASSAGNAIAASWWTTTGADSISTHLNPDELQRLRKGPR
jgi:hypothetical protein